MGSSGNKEGFAPFLRAYSPEIEQHCEEPLHAGGSFLRTIQANFAGCLDPMHELLERSGLVLPVSFCFTSVTPRFHWSRPIFPIELYIAPATRDDAPHDFSSIGFFGG
jgi:hypothetical protein